MIFNAGAGFIPALSATTAWKAQLRRVLLGFGLLVLALCNTAFAQVVVSNSTFIQGNNVTEGQVAQIILKNTAVAGSAFARLGYLEFDLSSMAGTQNAFPSTWALNLLVTGNNEGSVPTAPQNYPGATPCPNGANPCSPAAFTVEIWGLTDNTTPWSDVTLNWNNAPGGPYVNGTTIGNTFNNPAAPCNGNCAVYLATGLVSPNMPLSTVSFSSAELTNYMNSNALAGNSGVTLMLRRTDTNPQANLSFGTKYYPGSSGICAPTGVCTPTFGPPGYFGTAANAYQGPVGAYYSTATPTVTTATPTSTVTNGVVNATLGGTLGAGTGGAEQYVEYSLTGQNNWTSINIGGGLGGAFSTVINTLAGGTTYDVQAYAVSNGSTVYGGIETFTTQAAAPTGLSATAGDGVAVISFAAGATGGNAITNYDYSTDGGTTWIPLSPAQTGSPVTISGLTNGTPYSIMLRAENTLGAGMSSSAVSVTPSALPAVSGISPTSGSAGGGATVTITGSGFTGATGVFFGGTAASSFTVVSDTQITATSPARSAGVADVTVTTPGGTSTTGVADRFTYLNAPGVSGIAPTSGSVAGGTTVTITGSGFTGATGVSFGGTAASGFTVLSDTQITATSPAGSAGVANITVTTPGGTSTTGVANQFTYALIATQSGIATGIGNITANLTVTGCASLSSVSAVQAPAGMQVTFPYGLVRFVASGCTSGGAAQIQIQYTGTGVNLGGARTYQCDANTCAEYAGATINGNTITYTVTDGGYGDQDNAQNSSITDPVGPGIPVSPTTMAVPVLPRGGELLLAVIVGLSAIWTLRRAST